MVLSLLLAGCAAAPVSPPPPVPPVGRTDGPDMAPHDAPAPTSPTTTGAAPDPKVPTMLGEVTGVYFTGDWTSPSCAARTYARNLTIEYGGGYAGIDLVSPCPAGTQCIWSGLVAYAGIWKQEGNKVLLREIGAPIERGSPHPTEIEATKEGKLVENGCEYTRGLTVPPGYTEDQVRPHIPGSAGGPSNAAESKGGVK